MTRKILLWHCALLACLLANAGMADEIYKSVDKDGNVEFSDRPSPDADRVEVDPNVVQSNPVRRRSPSSTEPDAASDTAADAGREPTEQVTEVVADPDPGRATRNAVRNASPPPPRPQPRPNPR